MSTSESRVLLSRLPLPARVALLTTSIILAACGESTAPRPFAVNLVASSTLGVLTESPEGPIIGCDVDLVASAHGSGTATWQDATFRFFYGYDRAASIDTQVVLQRDVQDAWGMEQIAAGEEQRSPWVFGARAPFETEVTFRYKRPEDDKAGEATTRFTCGRIPPEGTPMPTITRLEVTPAGEVEAGDTITVTYSASSPFALWATGVVTIGPFDTEQVFSEKMAKTATRILRLVVPRGARRGVPLTVRVYAQDPALQNELKTITTGITTVDRTAPVLERARLAEPSLSSLAGQFGVGDAMVVYVTASDKEKLAWLVYELGAPANVRDSVPAPADVPVSLTWALALKAKPEWVGAPVLSLHVRDAAGNASATIRSLADSVRVYPVVDRPASAAVPLGFDLDEFAYDARRNRVYLNKRGTSQIAVLDPATMRFDAPIDLGEQVGGVGLSTGGDSLLVALQARNAIAIVDLTRPSTAPQVIPIPLLDTAGTSIPGTSPRPARVVGLAGGRALVALSAPTKSGALAVSLDLGSGVQRLRTDLATLLSNSAVRIGTMASAPDGSFAVLASGVCLRRFVVADDTFTECASLTSMDLRQITFDATGSRIGYERHVLDSELRRVATAPRMWWTLPSVTLSSDGTLAYLAADAHVAVMRVADGALLERWSVPIVAERMLVAPDGAWLLVFEGSAQDRVVRVDLH